MKLKYVEEIMELKILEFLACPLSKEGLQWDADKQELIAVKSGLAYRVDNDIPVLLVDEARQMSQEEKKKWRK